MRACDSARRLRVGLSATAGAPVNFALAAIFGISNSLGYLLPAIIGLESMGIPSPGETALVAAAVLASQGKLEIWLVILIAACSAIAGDNIGYLLGRRLGREVLEANGPLASHRRRALDAGDRFFAKHGAPTVFLGRWIALIRIATAWLAGINEMRFVHFFLWNAFGGITWAVTYGLVGYYGGQAAANVLSQIGIAGAVILALAVIGFLIYLKVRHEPETAEQDAAQASDEGAQAPVEPHGAAPAARPAVEDQPTSE
jgi:membrane protein DedA with SNARE-associated domain